jgi:hypothetical protein
MSIGLTENEFMMARMHQRNVNGVIDDANVIIARKNASLSAAYAEIARLRAEVLKERGLRRAAELHARH